MQRIRKGDEVVVIAGKYKGKKGKVLKVVEDKVLVDNINVVHKHMKPNPMKGEIGGVVDKIMPIQISNVSLINPATGKPGKIGYRMDGESKVRYFRSNGDLVGN